MKFGVFNVMQQRSPDTTSARQVIDEALDQARVADELGFDSCWFPEHHASNYSLCPSPLMMVARCAAVTKRIRLGTGVIVAPLYTPMRLLSEIGLVDILTDGRLDLGLGAGYQPFEFDRFGVDLSANKSMTLEILDMIEAGLTTPKFSYEGQHFNQPSSSIPLRPDDVPPIWLVGNDPAFHQRAAERGYAIFVSGLLGRPDSIAKLRSRIDETVTDHLGTSRSMRFGLLRYAFVSKDRARARKYAECALYQTRIAAALRRGTEHVFDDYVVREQPFEGEPSIDELLDRLIIGDPETCIERAAKEIRDARITDLVLQAKIGDLPHAWATESLRLWMEEVVPGIARELGQPIEEINA